MRRPRLSFARRRSNLLLLLLAAGMSFGVSSCSKDESDNNKTAVSQQAVASVVTQSVVNSGGIVEQISTAGVAVNALSARTSGGKLSDFCGQKKEDHFATSGEAGGLKFDVNMGWNFSLTCPQDVPGEFAFKFNSRTKLESEKFATNDSTIASYKISGLGENAANWSFNQTFDRMGKFTSKTTDLPSFNSTIHYTASDIKVSKETYEIISGSANVTVSGVDLKGNAFRYEGTITFQGNRKAVFVVNSGSNFNISW